MADDSARAIRDLLQRYGDAKALARLASIGRPVLPLLRQAYLAIEATDLLMGRWYNRVLAVVAPDPIGEVLSLLDRVDGRYAGDLSWILRRFAALSDRARFGDALAAGLSEPPDDLVWKLPRLALLCEAAGLVGEQEDMVALRRVLEVALAELARLRKDRALHLAGPDVAPAAAAAATGLLSISERHGLTNGPQRRAWRKVCVDMALADGYRQSYAISGQMEPPMPFLFARAPREASAVMVLLSGAGPDAEALLSAVHYWLAVAQEQEVAASLDLEAKGALDWLDGLDEQNAPGGHGPKTALNIRSMLQPNRALAEAMAVLARAGLDRQSVTHAVSILHQHRPFASISAIAVEEFFIRCSARWEGDGDAEARRGLNRSLAEAGLPATKGWTWSAPPGANASCKTPEGLHSTLCAVAQASSAAATPAGAAAVRALLRQAPPGALIAHAAYRCLLLALAGTGPRARPVPHDAPALSALDPLRALVDPALAGAVLTMARDLLRAQAGPVYLLLLDAPAARTDLRLAERLVQVLSYVGAPSAGERIFDLGREIGWGPGQGTYGVFAAITVAMGRLGVREAAPTLAKLVGTSGLGSECELALLRLAARHQGAVADADVARALAHAGADEYAELDASLLGDQARALTANVLRDADLQSPLFLSVCRFLALAGRGGRPPADGLPLLLKRMPAALSAAAAHPGEYWEDRNWGGYNESPEEKLVATMTEALETLSDGTLTREGWHTQLGGLLGLPGIDLVRVKVAKPDPLDLYARLRKNLRRLGDPAVDKALSIPEPIEALRAARAALS